MARGRKEGEKDGAPPQSPLPIIITALPEDSLPMTKPSVGRKLRQRRFERNGWSLAVVPFSRFLSSPGLLVSCNDILAEKRTFKGSSSEQARPRAGTGGRMDERTIGALTMVDGEDAYQATKTRKTYGRLWDLPHPQILLLGIARTYILSRG